MGRTGTGKKWITAALVCCLAVLVSGCAVRITYNQLDWIVPWYIDDYFNPQGEQEEIFDQRLDAYLRWHRGHQLPQYADFLEQVAQWVEVGLQAQNIETIEQQTEQFADALVQRLMPDMMDLLALATDDQVAELFEQLEIDGDEFREKYVEASAQQQRQERRKDLLHHVQRWTGKLNQDQTQLIVSWSEGYELMGVELQQSRIAWQNEFKRVLSLRHDVEAYTADFTQLMTNPGFGQSQELEAKLERNAEYLVTLYLQLDQSLTQKQRNRMVSKLRSYAKDFRVLSNQRH